MPRIIIRCRAVPMDLRGVLARERVFEKNRPASQVERLKRRVKEGRSELGAMYLNFDELPDEQTLAASLAPLKLFREEGLRTDLAMQDDVNGIAWCFSEYFADAGSEVPEYGDAWASGIDMLR